MSNSVKAGGNFVVLDLNPETWYNLRVTAHNNAGFSVAEYEFATLTVTGGNLSIYLNNCALFSDAGETTFMCLKLSRSTHHFHLNHLK